MRQPDSIWGMLRIFPRQLCASAIAGAILAFTAANCVPLSGQSGAPSTSDRGHIEEVLRGLNRGRGTGQDQQRQSYH